MSTPHPTVVLFARGTIARLASWPTLCLAVHASWGGPDSAEKQRWLAGIIVDQFEPFLPCPTPTASPPDYVFIEELLFQIMADEFDVVLEDDSAAVVAKDIITLFTSISTGDETFLHALEAQADTVKGKLPKYEIDGDSESDDEWEDDEDEQVPQLLDHTEPPQVDEDGFTIIKRKGHR